MLPHCRQNAFSPHVPVRRPQRSLLRMILLPLILLASTSHAETQAYVVKEFFGGVAAASPYAVAHNQLFFSGFDESHGAELWKSDGTTAGTSLVADMVPGSGSTDPRFITAVNDSVYFNGSPGLWKTDGTANGTVRLADPAWISYPFDLTNVNGTLLFASTADILGSSTVGLWKSDGTPNGTMLLRWHPAAIDRLTPVNGKLFYTAYETEHSRGLWVSDGTAAGTLQLQVFTNEATANEQLIQTLRPVGGRLFFSAYTSGRGYELWQSDGTATGTMRVSDTGPVGIPRAITDIQGTAFVLAQDSDRSALWTSDGTPTGTTLVKTFPPEQGPYNEGFLVNLNGIAIFPHVSPNQLYELWRSDGTAEGTVAIKTVAIRSTIPPSVSCGKLFFTAYGFDGLEGDDLWVSDGSPAGTLRVYDGGSGYSLNGQPLQPLTKVGDVLLFTDYSLWALPIGLAPAYVSSVDSLPYHLYLPLALGHPRC